MDDEARANGSKAQSPGVMQQATPDPTATTAASAPFFPGGVAYFPGNTSGVHPYSIFAGQVTNLWPLPGPGSGSCLDLHAA